MDSYDVVILGGGSAGEALAGRLADAGRSVAVVEALRVGGECPYVACMPSKALLRSAEARHQARRVASLGGAPEEPSLGSDDEAWARAVARRDDVAEHRDDSSTAKELEGRGVTVVRGTGRVVRPGVVAVGDRELGWTDLVVATGSRPVRPDVPGLDEVPTWTSDEALSAQERPASLLVMGGGAVGCELSQAHARFGVAVTLVESGEQLLGKEEPGVSELLAEALRDDGVDVRLGVEVQRTVPAPGGLAEVHLGDGSVVTVERVLVATGRQPASDGLGLEVLGISPDDQGALPTDDRCQVAPHVHALGDVTGVAPSTHTANYLARVLGDVRLGRPARADYRAIPRAVYTDPPVASVGLGEKAARDAGVDVVATTFDLAETARSATEGGRGGRLVLTADR
ncbi:MAG: dihydrolipoyl dehydrogenase family protein, partial [Nocardioidaceae bacterium]